MNNFVSWTMILFTMIIRKLKREVGSTIYSFRESSVGQNSETEPSNSNQKPVIPIENFKNQICDRYSELIPVQ
ncbi:hypothetical protein VNO77_17930 [Canavalia gladiata]|uniref:Uncharacterized protein n=1 Tax=Canavalia gladiata TaxID=3824 RepID=A0AAN9LNH3_CANGL